MFIGEYSHTIDAKGRLIVPSKFREQLGDEFVVTKGLDGCLFVYENSEWKSFEEKLHALPLTNANARKFSRFFLALRYQGLHEGLQRFQHRVARRVHLPCLPWQDSLHRSSS